MSDAPAKPKRPPVPVEEVRYMVWREGGDMPTVVHADWNTASMCAKSLSRKFPGERFHMLRTARIYVRTAVPETQS